jgi:hypothetical protein
VLSCFVGSSIRGLCDRDVCTAGPLALHHGGIGPTGTGTITAAGSALQARLHAASAPYPRPPPGAAGLGEAEATVAVVKMQQEQVAVSGSGDDVDCSEDQFGDRLTGLLATVGGGQVIGAWPRVLLLPQIPATALGDGGGGDVGGGGGLERASSRAEGGKRDAELTLRCIVAWDELHPTCGSLGLPPGANGPGALDSRVEVLYGNCGELVASVVLRDVVPTDTDGVASYKYDITLEKLPRQPGWIYVSSPNCAVRG